MSYYVSINGSAARVNEISDCFDVVLESESLMLQISKIDGIYKVTNAVNGWGNNCKQEYENAVINIYAELNHKSDSLYKEALFDFCKFICEKNYHINGYDDMQLASVIDKFMNKDNPELCYYCGYEIPNHEEKCIVYKGNIKLLKKTKKSKS